MSFEKNSHEEEEFHNKKASEISKKNLYSSGILNKADIYAYELLGDLQGRVILDIGCGNGHHAVKFAERGAIVYAIDLSWGMVQKAKRKVKEKELDGYVKVLQMEVENLKFPDGTFDLVFGHSILHHTNLGLARTQVQRVLKYGGKGVFLEPLGHNPFINLYRRLTPKRRTSSEKPMRFDEVEFFAKPFSDFIHREFYLFALAGILLLPVSLKGTFQRTINWLSNLDDKFLTHLPILGRYAWVTVFRVVK